jgi:hypothetical protein
MLGTWLTNSAGSNFDSSVYTYNVGNQRTTATRTGENTAAYTYDVIGQVLGDQASEVSGGAARMNEQLHYAFDPVGNLNYRTNNTLIENFQVNTVHPMRYLTFGRSASSCERLQQSCLTNIMAVSHGVNELTANTNGGKLTVTWPVR